MTELKLYKFINDNSIEWHKIQNKDELDVLILPYVFQLQDFCELVQDYNMEEGITAVIKNGYVGIYMNDICEYFGIEINNVFVGNDGNC